MPPESNAVEINGRVARAIIADARVVQARRMVCEAKAHLRACEDAHTGAWNALSPDEEHEANLCVLAGLELAA